MVWIAQQEETTSDDDVGVPRADLEELVECHSQVAPIPGPRQARPQGHLEMHSSTGA